MTTFNLTINLDNEAFHDGDGDLDPAPEIHRLLTRAIEPQWVISVGDNVNLRDVNGNTVGHWGITE